METSSPCVGLHDERMLVTVRRKTSWITKQVAEEPHPREQRGRQGGLGDLRSKAHAKPDLTPSHSGTPPGLSAIAPYKGRDYPYTMDDATMQHCGVDLPVSRYRREDQCRHDADSKFFRKPATSLAALQALSFTWTPKIERFGGADHRIGRALIRLWRIKPAPTKSPPTGSVGAELVAGREKLTSRPLCPGREEPLVVYAYVGIAQLGDTLGTLDNAVHFRHLIFPFPPAPAGRTALLGPAPCGCTRPRARQSTRSPASGSPRAPSFPGSDSPR